MKKLTGAKFSRRQFQTHTSPHKERQDEGEEKKGSVQPVKVKIHGLVMLLPRRHGFVTTNM